jgi:CDP-glucose 4,6-dehydratase
MFADQFRNKTVWISGHTGFKGAWLTQWLLQLGAKVHGFALSPNTNPALFEQLNLAEQIANEFADIRDLSRVKTSIQTAQPDFVFHLAAQPLVRTSYEKPIETYEVNVMGTAHVLEALRDLKKPCVAVFVTTDKCYENREWIYGYRENEPLGGHDPYSSSKAAAEIVISAYRRSFFANHPVKIASARAGNVIGGGDWALDRIVPDCIRALQKGKKIPVRNRTATRPWQHVLEPLSGYLWLAAVLQKSDLVQAPTEELAAAFNFGPTPEANRTVLQLVEEILRWWPGSFEDKSNPNAVHEAKLLQLSIEKARAILGWFPVWNFPTTIGKTVEWYKTVSENSSRARNFTTEQIEQFAADAAKLALPWAVR